MQENCLVYLVHGLDVRSVDDVLSVPSSADDSPAEGHAVDALEPPEGVPVQGPQTLGQWLAEEQEAFFAWCDDLMSPCLASPESPCRCCAREKVQVGCLQEVWQSNESYGACDWCSQGRVFAALQRLVAVHR